ncbi:hypothetical protein [Variovorax sp. IB41]|uniref:hypothetical protein n=1 Tax=Variovorax sp. IB41 TaxID=2779370 RepID=UPI0018E88770|nr:hypothetical protein [Variovorax sp. IB41]MBJ2159284.1 hypothetical protein [Variovorax sp. IB41]
MAGQLISISLTVDQHDAGDYFWVLLESFDNSMEFEPLMEAATGFATYGDALQAGYVVLKGLSEDLNVGPREEGDDPDIVVMDEMEEADRQGR